MPARFTTYVVKTGDTLSKIAKRFGLKSWQEVYNDPYNATFRVRHPNPNLIVPGDVVRISDRCCDLEKTNECPYTGDDRSSYTCPPGYVKYNWTCAEGTIHRYCGECCKAPSGSCWEADSDDWHCSIWWYGP
jgi:hypothetical protein